MIMEKAMIFRRNGKNYSDLINLAKAEAKHYIAEPEEWEKYRFTGKQPEISDSGFYTLDGGSCIRDLDFLLDMNYSSCSNDLLRAMVEQGVLSLETYLTPIVRSYDVTQSYEEFEIYKYLKTDNNA